MTVKNKVVYSDITENLIFVLGDKRSPTLYDTSVKKLREDWFTECQNQGFSTENILKFHHTAGIGDSNIDLMMDRGLGGTVSITSVKKNKDIIKIDYEDMLTKKKSLLIL